MRQALARKSYQFLGVASTRSNLQRTLKPVNRVLMTPGNSKKNPFDGAAAFGAQWSAFSCRTFAARRFFVEVAS